MTPELLTVLTFLAGVLAVVGVYSIVSDLFLSDRSRVSRRLDEEFRKRQRDQARKSPLFKNLGQLMAEAAADEAADNSLRQRLELLVEQSGLHLTPQRLLALAVCSAVAVGVIGGLVRQSVLIGVIVAPVGALVPFYYVHRKRKARLGKLLGQLPDAFDLMARVIRAGQTVAQGLQAVADEFEAPIAAEFGYCYEQQNLGLPPEVALRDLARRTGLVEIKILVLALLVQQQTGGNLADMLDKLSTVVRERFRVRGKIQALTAEGRLQAVVLLLLPPVAFLILLMINRDYGQVLLGYPYLLIGALVMQAFGALWIHRIVNFDF
jgi:tight adherence protein B